MGIRIDKSVTNAGNAPAIYTGAVFPYPLPAFGTFFADTVNKTWNYADGAGNFELIGSGTATQDYSVKVSTLVSAQFLDDGHLSKIVATYTVPIGPAWLAYRIECWVKVTANSLAGVCRAIVSFYDKDNVLQSVRMTMNSNTDTIAVQMSNTVFYSSAGLYINAKQGTTINVAVTRGSLPLNSTVTFDALATITNVTL
jgi:hypothetical protein